MRIIHFTADMQILSVDADDIKNMIKGSQNYYVAFFSLSADYDGCKVAACFSTDTQKIKKPKYTTGRKTEPEYEDDTKVSYVGLKKNACIIPADVLKNDKFTVKLYAQKDDTIIPTSEIIVTQGE